MMDEPNGRVSYHANSEAREVERLPVVDTLPAPLLEYLRERRRAIITELRKIESMLDMEQSIPARKRPH